MPQALIVRRRTGCRSSRWRSVLAPAMAFVGLVFLSSREAAAYTLTATANHGSVTVDPNKAQYEAGEVVRLVPLPDVGYSFRNWTGGISTRCLAPEITMDGDKAVAATFDAWVPPIGIPEPNFGIVETYRMYDDPARRNPDLTYTRNAEGGYYTHYIDNTHPNATDTQNPYGTATKPRLSIPVSGTAIPAGSVVEIHGGPYAKQFGYLLKINGTQAQPVFIRGYTSVVAQMPEFNGMAYDGYGIMPNGTYFVIENLYMHGAAINVAAKIAIDSMHHIAIRNIHSSGAGILRRYDNVVVSGSDTTPVSYVVIYGNHIHHHGYPPDPGQVDVCGVVPAGNIHHVWVLDNHIHDNGGDGLQASTSARGHHIYIGRNVMHRDGENAIDIKGTNDVVISQNSCFDYYTQGLGGSGEVMVFHVQSTELGPLRLWALFNYVDHANLGLISSSGTRSVYTIGNVIHEINGSAINGWNGGYFYHIGNTIYNTGSGIGAVTSTAAAVVNNIVAHLKKSDAYHLEVEYAPMADASVASNNLFFQEGTAVRIRWGANAYTGLAGFQAATGKGQNSVEANPFFLDGAGPDFLLGSASPAIDAGLSAGVVKEVFDLFYNTYGIDIRRDMQGRIRAAAWDIGAYEYTLSAITDLSVREVSQNSVTLVWTVPGERGTVSRPTSYDIRYSGSPLTESNWAAATSVPGAPAPGDLGQPESFTISGLNPGTTYYVAAKAGDSAGRFSPLSNVVSGTTTASGNHAPVLGPIGDRSVVETETLAFSISATDADGDPLTYSALNLPAGAGFSAATQTFTWTPTGSQSGGYRVLFQVSDTHVTVSETITITVRAGANQPPALTPIGNRSVDENASLSFSLGATDPDGDPLTFSALGLPNGASLTGRTFTWTPNYDQAGSYSVTFTVSDGELTDSEQITITVAGVTDRAAPAAHDFWPAAEAIQVPPSTLVALTISDEGLGVDAGTVAIRVNNQLVYSGDGSLCESASGTCRRTGTAASYRYYYQPAQAFDFDEHVAVAVTASDLAHNAMTPVSYQFVTEMPSFGRNQLVSSEGDSSGCPAVTTDSQGNLWAAWHAGPADARDIYVAKRDAQGQMWELPLRLTTLASDQCQPAIAVGPDNALYVAWQDNRRGNWDIYVSVSRDGITWDDPLRVTDSNDPQANPVLAVDHASPYRVYIAWEDGNPGSRDIHLASSSTSFADKTVARITSDPADQTEPALAVGSDNTVYLVWTDARNGSADIYGSSSGVSSWANVPFVMGPGHQSSPALAVEPGTSTLHLLWVDDAAGDLNVVHGTSNGLPGGPISGTVIVDDTTHADQSAPALAIAQDYGGRTHVYACWQDHRFVGSARDTDLYFVEIRSGAGGTNILVGDDGANSNQSDPVLGVDRYGQPALLWTDSRGSVPRIYSACRTYFKPVALDSALITRAAGGRVGVDPAAIDGAGDVSIQIPAGACDSDVVVSISEIQNQPSFAASSVVGYEISPSGVHFSLPATVTIPYAGSGTGLTTPYWYDALTATLSQQGMTEITRRTLANGVPVISFKTNHLTTFYVLESPLPIQAEEGGGCAMSRSRDGSAVNYFLPYGAFVLFLLILKRRDHKRKGA